MKTPTIFYFCCLIILLATGCENSGVWSDEKIKKFETECLQSDSIYNQRVSFRGFESNEFDSVLVLEFKDTVLIDSFRLFVLPSQSPYEKERKDRSSYPLRSMNINNKYRFIVPGQTFEVTNMKKEMKSQYPGWGCGLGSCEINGIKVEDLGLYFIKDTLR